MGRVDSRVDHSDDDVRCRVRPDAAVPVAVEAWQLGPSPVTPNAACAESLWRGRRRCPLPGMTSSSPRRLHLALCHRRGEPFDDRKPVGQVEPADRRSTSVAPASVRSPRIRTMTLSVSVPPSFSSCAQPGRRRPCRRPRRRRAHRAGRRPRSRAHLTLPLGPHRPRRTAQRPARPVARCRTAPPHRPVISRPRETQSIAPQRSASMSIMEIVIRRRRDVRRARAAQAQPAAGSSFRPGPWARWPRRRRVRAGPWSDDAAAAFFLLCRRSTIERLYIVRAGWLLAGGAAQRDPDLRA